ncbi:MAG: carboxypeptidase-like regulatory domain-containing protein, partial [Bacteroidota bacterium]
MKIYCLTGFLSEKTKKKWGRIMRLTLFLMVGFLLSASANSYSQNTRLDIKLKNGTVAELIQYVENNSEFVFLYKTEDLDLKKKVSVSLEEATIDEVLLAALNEQDLEWDVYDRQIVLRKSTTMPDQAAGQQQRTVTGTVTDQNGEPLPGVTVLVEGTTTGTVTNSDGNFSLNVPADAETLQFSFVGMRTQEVAINGRTTFTVVMEEEAIGLEEVVAIGYGTVKKSDLTGAVANVTEDNLTAYPSTNAIQSMQGRAAGVTIQSVNGEPGGNFKIRVRGSTSINASSNPLFVIDGLVGGSIPPPEDIASIEILKDASATSIYGSRGANGVVMITTKSGRAGETTVKLNSYYS